MAGWGERERQRRTQWLAENGPCQGCGTWENLQVDHIDPGTKEYEPGDVWCMRQEKRDAELAKCQALCFTCHVEKSAAETRAKPRTAISEAERRERKRASDRRRYQRQIGGKYTYDTKYSHEVGNDRAPEAR